MLVCDIQKSGNIKKQLKGMTGSSRVLRGTAWTIGFSGGLDPDKRNLAQLQAQSLARSQEIEQLLIVRSSHYGCEPPLAQIVE
jgi:hypothetical protein